MGYNQDAEDIARLWEDERNRSVIKSFFMERALDPFPSDELSEEAKATLQSGIDLCKFYEKGVKDYLAVHSGELDMSDTGSEYDLIEGWVTKEIGVSGLQIQLNDELVMERVRRGKELCERTGDYFQAWLSEGKGPLNPGIYNWLCSFIDYGPLTVAQTDEEAAEKTRWPQQMI